MTSIEFTQIELQMIIDGLNLLNKSEILYRPIAADIELLQQRIFGITQKDNENEIY